MNLSEVLRKYHEELQKDVDAEARKATEYEAQGLTGMASIAAGKVLLGLDVLSRVEHMLVREAIYKAGTAPVLRIVGGRHA